MAKIKLEHPADTVYERIMIYMMDENYVLSEQDAKVLERVDFAHGYLCKNLCSKEKVRKVLIKKFSVSVRTARKDVEGALSVYFDPKVSNKSQKRAMLEEFQMRILQASWKANDLDAANRSIANLIKITGIESKDVVDLSAINLPSFILMGFDNEVAQELPENWRDLLDKERQAKEEYMSTSRKTIDIDIAYEVEE